MSKETGLKLSPIHPQGRDDVWFYEDRDGLHVIVDKSTTANRCAFDFKISYRSIEAYMRRRNGSK